MPFRYVKDSDGKPIMPEVRSPLPFSSSSPASTAPFLFHIPHRAIGCPSSVDGTRD